MKNTIYASSCLHVVLNVFIFMLCMLIILFSFELLDLNQKITNPSFEFETWYMQFSGHLSTTHMIIFEQTQHSFISLLKEENVMFMV
jgi:TRAP-type C4-dicarboxylate transport system permease small subunit